MMVIQAVAETARRSRHRDGIGCRGSHIQQMTLYCGFGRLAAMGQVSQCVLYRLWSMYARFRAGIRRLFRGRSINRG